MNNGLTQAILAGALIILIGIFVKAVNKGLALLEVEAEKNIKDENVRQLALDVISVVKNAVAAANQTIVKPLKADGLRTEDEAKRVKKEVEKSVKDVIGKANAKKLSELQADYISKTIEAEVFNQKEKLEKQLNK